MIKLEDLMYKEEKEIKEIMKDIIVNEIEDFDWENFSLEYNIHYADYDIEEEEGDDYKSIMWKIREIIDEEYVDYYCDNLLEAVYVDGDYLVIEDKEGERYRVHDMDKIKECITFIIKSTVDVLKNKSNKRKNIRII